MTIAPVVSTSGRRLLIRALASSAWGLGHLMRCRNLAECLQERGWSIEWWLDETALELAHRLTLPGELHHLAEGEMPASARPGDVLLFDGYTFTESDFREATRHRLMTLLIDDGVIPGLLPVDLLVNGSLEASPSIYAGRGPLRILLGPDYAPLRSTFFRAAEQSRRETDPASDAPQEWLVLFGGSDPLDLTRGFLDAIALVDLPKNCRVNLVTGAAYPDPGDVDQRLQGDRRLAAVRHWHQVEDMIPLMQKARMALTAAGSTVFELSTLQVPAVLLVVADNQIANTRAMQAQGYCQAFDVRRGADWSSILSFCLERWPTLESGEARHAAAPRWCDGRGVWRIAGALEAPTAIEKR